MCILNIVRQGTEWEKNISKFSFSLFILKKYSWQENESLLELELTKVWSSDFFIKEGYSVVGEHI